MADGFLRKSSLLLSACGVLSAPLAIYLVSGHTRTLSNDPVQVLTQYLKAAYARDFTTAYYIEATPLETYISGNRARVKLKLKLPDGLRRLSVTYGFQVGTQ